MKFIPIIEENSDAIHSIFPGDEGKYWVNFNWYWAEISKRRTLINSELIMLGETPIGFASFGQHYSNRQLTFPVKGYYEIYHLVVDANSQGMGLGKEATIKILGKFAGISDCEKIVVACNSENTKAGLLYKALGFQEFSKNYDNDPLLILDKSETSKLPLSKSQPKIIHVDLKSNEMWIQQCRESLKEFNWQDWEMGIVE